MSRTLDALKGTEFAAVVRRQDDTDYIVTVSRPATDGEQEIFHKVLGHATRGEEIVGSRYLGKRADKYMLETAVRDIIAEYNRETLVGVYHGEEENL